jgi:hypothetical protein
MRKRVHAAVQAKRPGDLLLHFEHAQIAFGLVAVEGDRQVVEEGERRVLAQPKAFEQVPG